MERPHPLFPRICTTLSCRCRAALAVIQAPADVLLSVRDLWLLSGVLGVAQNASRLDSEIIYDRDFDYDYFGFKVDGLDLPYLSGCANGQIVHQKNPFSASLRLLYSPVPLPFHVLRRLRFFSDVLDSHRVGRYCA